MAINRVSPTGFIVQSPIELTLFVEKITGDLLKGYSSGSVKNEIRILRITKMVL